MKKIIQILQEWPPNTVITSDWLQTKGVYRQLVDSYINSGWLERVGTGAYKRNSETITWAGGLYALQKLKNLSVHPGGKTALELSGFGQQKTKGNQRNVVLWKTPDVRLPTWFLHYDWKKQLEIRSANLFESGVDSFLEKQVDQTTVTISSPERAVLEYMHDIPKHEGVKEANYLMEGLPMLRPDILQTLLERCRSIKVKRLFLYLANRHKYAWFRGLDQSKIDLGKGKREIHKGGLLDRKYKIIVPYLTRKNQ